jgi:hypothetical protein
MIHVLWSSSYLMFAHVIFRCLFLGQRDPLILMRLANSEFHGPHEIVNWTPLSNLFNVMALIHGDASAQSTNRMNKIEG